MPAAEEREAALAQALAITHRMLNHCREASWDPLPALAEARHDLLLRAFDGRPAPHQAERFAAAIARLQDLDRQILDHCQRQKEEWGRALHRIARGRRASDAYLRESL